MTVGVQSVEPALDRGTGGAWGIAVPLVEVVGVVPVGKTGFAEYGV